MNNKKDNDYYINKIIENIDAIIKYTKNKSEVELLNDNILLDAIMFRLVQLAENINNLSYEFRNKYSTIPWGEIIGFRNGIVHDYGKTNYSIVIEIIYMDVYTLKEQIEQIILEENNNWKLSLYIK